MNYIKLMMIALASLLLVKPAMALEISDLDNPKITTAFVDGLVLPLMKNHNSPAGTVAIMKEGKLVFAKGYGFQDVEKHIPVDPDKSLFRPGSVSKLFTWVSVMQMVEQGKLDLDADVNTYLNTFQIKDTFPGHPVTMRDIMTHSAGFEDGGMGYLIITDLGRIMPLAESLKRYQPERVNLPGAQTAYSNYATSIAGLIVANLSGIEFTDYIKKNIFDVLGMNNSSFKEPLPDHLIENMTQTYAYEGGKYVEKPFEVISNFAPAGAQSATAADMVIFAQAILNGGEYNGGRILKPETVKQMLTRNFSHDDRMMGMALGFYETDHNGLRFLGHGGDTSAFHSELVIDQENDLVFFVSFAAGGGSTVRSAFKEAFYDAFYPVESKKITPPADFADRAAKYAGSYKFWRGSFSTIEKALGLAGSVSIQPTADNTLVLAFGPFGGQFAEIDNNLFQKIDGTDKLAFQENNQGEITGFVLDGLPFMSTYKAPFYSTGGFNYSLLSISMLVFLGVMLRLAYQWSGFRALTGINKKVARAAVMTASSNLLTFILLAIVLVAYGNELGSNIPFLFKAWMILPIIATIAGLYNLYYGVIVWKEGLCSGFWARIRYSFVALSSLFLCWFYYFWNFLGFQYMG